MNDATQQRGKRCPVCEKEYPEQDNYCGDDGSVLDRSRDTSGKQLPQSVVAPTTLEDMTSESESSLQL
jgi:hypothetical protein